MSIKNGVLGLTLLAMAATSCTGREDDSERIIYPTSATSPDFANHQYDFRNIPSFTYGNTKFIATVEAYRVDNQTIEVKGLKIETSANTSIFLGMQNIETSKDEINYPNHTLVGIAGATYAVPNVQYDPDSFTLPEATLVPPQEQ